MKNYIYVRSLSIVTAIVFLLSCQSYTDKIEVSIEYPTIPVLVKKEVNPVAKITLVCNATTAYTLDRLVLNMDNMTDINDIVSVGLYKANGKGMIDTSALIYRTKDISKTIRFSEPVEISKDTAIFWLAVKLKDVVELDHVISVNCTSLGSSLGELKINKSEKKPLRVGVAVRQHKQDGVHTSRIPGLETTNKGTLIAMFDARYDSGRDLQGHMDIAIHRSTDKGKTWQPMQIVLDMGEWGGLPQKYNGVSDGCVLIDKNSEDIYIAGLWMHGVLDGETGKWKTRLANDSTYWIHQWNKKGSQPGLGVKQTSQFLIAKSSDDGLTWSDPKNITADTKRPEWWLFAPAPGHGITMADGTLVFPSQGRDAKGMPFSNITYSKDGGNTWVTSAPAFNDVTECMAVELEHGEIMLNMRDNRNRNNKEKNGRRICVTHDFGNTWKEHPSSGNTLTEPTCMGSLHKHVYKKDGQEKSLLLFVNPNSYSTRNNITLKISFDNGMTWPEEKWILLDEYRSAGYSCITSVDENTIGIIYESSQANLAFLRIKLDELLN